jgi:hypothetical protein
MASWPIRIGHARRAMWDVVLAAGLSAVTPDALFDAIYLR